MAVLEKIRERGLLLVIVVGVALGAFILGDLSGSSSSRNSNSEEVFGSINGEEIDPNTFSEYLDNVKSQYSTLPEGEQNKRAWDFLVNEKLIGSAASDLGITITPKEIYELETGAINNINRHDAFNNFFTSNGQVEFNIEEVNNFFDNFSQQSPEIQNYFLQLTDGVTKERLSQKYQTLIEKGMYTTNSEVITTLNERNQNAEVKYISIPYPVEEVEVTDEEISEYYNNNISDYQNESYRSARRQTSDFDGQ